MKEFMYTFRKEKCRIYLFVTIVTIMITSTLVQSQFAHGTDVSFEAQYASLDEMASQYAGAFSAAVASSVNPTATLAALAILGVVEQSDEYFPDSEIMCTIGDFLGNTPIVGMAGDLPVANIPCAIFLTVVAVLMYILHSMKGTKLASKTTIDNIEQWGGLITTMGIALMPVMTMEVVAAEQGITYVHVGVGIILWIISILTAIFSAIAYWCIYGCIDALETICAAIPIKGMNLVVEVGKALLHGLLMILIVCMPVLSVILSIIIIIVGFVLFKKLTRLSKYYMTIYLKPLWKAIRKKEALEPWVHKKFPKKGQKKFPETAIAIPVFTMNKINKVKKKEMLWLMVVEQEPYVMRIKPFAKVMKWSLRELVGNDEDVIYLHKAIRFLRIITADQRVELIVSKEYANQFEELCSRFNLVDYKVFEDEKKAKKKEEKEQKKIERLNKKMAKTANQSAPQIEAQPVVVEMGNTARLDANE